MNDMKTVNDDVEIYLKKKSPNKSFMLETKLPANDFDMRNFSLHFHLKWIRYDLENCLFDLKSSFVKQTCDQIKCIYNQIKDTKCQIDQLKPNARIKAFSADGLFKQVC